MTSEDGALTLQVPEGAPEVTIADGTASDPFELGGLDFESIASYDLGPDGSEFDPPITAEFTLDSVPDDAILVVIHRRGDVEETLDIEFTDGGFRTELDSFSGFEVILTGSLSDGDVDVEIAWDPGEPSNGLVFDGRIELDHSTELGIDENWSPVRTDGEWTNNGAGAPDGSVDCSAGEPIDVGFTGEVTWGLGDATGHTRKLDASGTLGCTPPLMDVDPLDQRCFGAQGEELVGVCPAGEELATAVGADGQTITASATVPTGWQLEWGLDANTADGGVYIYNEIDAMGAVDGYIGAGLEYYQGPTDNWTIDITEVGGALRFTYTGQVACAPDGTGRVIRGGEKFDGSTVEDVIAQPGNLTAFGVGPNDETLVVNYDAAFATCP